MSLRLSILRFDQQDLRVILTAVCQEHKEIQLDRCLGEFLWRREEHFGSHLSLQAFAIDVFGRLGMRHGVLDDLRHGFGYDEVNSYTRGIVHVCFPERRLLI